MREPRITDIAFRQAYKDTYLYAVRRLGKSVTMCGKAIGKELRPLVNKLIRT